VSVRLTWLADDLRAEGCKVVEIDGWEHAGRDGAFDPDGPCWHHTGTTTSESNSAPTLNTCIHGRSDLPGPLCQVMIGYDGTVYVIAAGRANHAGAHNGWGPYTSSRDGNDQMFGMEIDYDGTQKMSSAQKTAATKVSAVVLRRFGHDHSWATRHEETSTTGKWDTGGLTGDQIRSLVKDYMANPDTGEGILGMSNVKVLSNPNDQKFRGNGDWLTVTLDSEGDLSLITGPRDIYEVQAGMTVDVSGASDSIRSGDVVKARFQQVIDYPGDKATEVESSYPIHELEIGAGASYFNLSWLNKIAGDVNGGQRKVRLFILPPEGKTLKVTGLTARVGY
jgi:N-acetylmuramoyl-L-alanine amidase